MFKKLKKVICYVSAMAVLLVFSGVLTACGADPTELVSNMVSLEYTSAVYTGSAFTPAVTIVVDDETIDATHYTVEYSNNTNVGSASVKITANEDDKLISGSITVGFEITKASAGARNLAEVSTIIANGNYDTVIASEDITVGENETLTIPEGFTLNMGDHVLTNNGTVVNNGTIVENKNILGEGSLTNNGTIRAEVKTFDDMKNAIKFANYIKVMADMDAVAPEEGNDHAEENKFYTCTNETKYDKLVVDLNGHTLKKQIRFDSSFGSRTVEITNTASTQAVVDTRGLKVLPAVFPKGNATTEASKFTVKLNNIKFIGDGTTDSNNSWAAFSTNGSFAGEYYFVIATNCVFENNGNACGAYCPAGYNYTFTNCTFTGASGYYAKSGTHTLTNCTFNGTKAEYIAPNYNGNGCYETGSALVLDSAQNYNEPLVVNINGGVFNSVAGYGIEEYATSKNGNPNFYSTLNITGNPTYTFGEGKKALAVPSFIANNAMENASAVVDALIEKAYNNESVLGKETNYTVAQLKAKITDAEYYVELGTVEFIGNLNTLKIGEITFASTEEYPMSIGNNNFIVDKAFYVEDGKLYIAAPILVFEAQGNNKIELNGKEFIVNFNQTMSYVAVSELKHRGTGNSVTKVADSVNKYNVTLSDAKSYLEIHYLDSASTDVVVARKYINGKVTYGLTAVENETVDGTQNIHLGLYTVGWYQNFNDVPAENNGATMIYSFYVVGKGMATVELNITLNK